MQQFFQQKHSRTTLNTKYTVTIGNLRLSFAKFPFSIFTLYQAAAPAVTPGWKHWKLKIRHNFDNHDWQEVEHVSKLKMQFKVFLCFQNAAFNSSSQFESWNKKFEN